MAINKGFVVPAGGGKHLEMSAPGRFADLKLMREQTGDSVMLFEESLPAGTKSTFHLHHHSDEVAWVLEGEMTFKMGDEVITGGPGTCAFLVRNVPHAWKNSGPGIARVLFLYTPALAGGYLEEMLELSSPMSAEDQARLCKAYSWEIVGRNPL
jgi:quercetin dioxygenase-like cupin family protein